MKMHKIFAVSACLFLLAACGGPTPPPTPTPTPTPVPTPTQIPTMPPNTGVRYHFVTDTLLVPTTQAQAESFGLNVDGDAQGRPDNLFGNLLTLLVTASPGLELQPAIDQAIDDGQLVTLHLLQAVDPLNASNASWSIFLGQPAQSPPDFDGLDEFTIDPAAPTNSMVSGSIANGRFSGGPGTTRLKLSLLNRPIELNLIGVRLEANVNAQGCTNGKLGGGISVEEFRAGLFPALADGMTVLAQSGATGAATLLQGFDADQNGTITALELENHFLVKVAVTPDLDLLDASGVFNPNQDGVKDSLSIGLGFTCASANFTAPGD